jgi:uncharacterized protein (DUF302 family)
MTTPLRVVVRDHFDAVVARTIDALKSEGFGVLSDIDVQGTLKQKIGAELPRYRVLGACNPPFALEAIKANADAGLMMPCNVIVHEQPDGTVVRAVDPSATAAAFADPALMTLASSVRQKLERVMAQLSA